LTSPVSCAGTVHPARRLVVEPEIAANVRPVAADGTLAVWTSETTFEAALWPVEFHWVTYQQYAVPLVSAVTVWPVAAVMLDPVYAPQAPDEYVA